MNMDPWKTLLQLTSMIYLYQYLISLCSVSLCLYIISSYIQYSYMYVIYIIFPFPWTPQALIQASTPGPKTSGSPAGLVLRARPNEGQGLRRGYHARDLIDFI